MQIHTLQRLRPVLSHALARQIAFSQLRSLVESRGGAEEARWRLPTGNVSYEVSKITQSDEFLLKLTRAQSLFLTNTKPINFGGTLHDQRLLQKNGRKIGSIFSVVK